MHQRPETLASYFQMLGTSLCFNKQVVIVLNSVLGVLGLRWHGLHSRGKRSFQKVGGNAERKEHS